MADPETLPVDSAVEAAPGLRSRLSRIAGRSSGAPPELEPILRTLRQFHPKSDTRVVIQAYVTAEELHREQKRRSGEPYITHPVAVAQILADLGMTGPTLAAALLHDTVEDTGYPLADLRAEFGEEIASLVDGVTKLDKVTYGASSAAETVRKMVVAMARDIRVLVIKLADRLHNMRTLQWMPPEKQAIKARETLEIYAPLAHRLGMNTVKWELEDLSFATLHPKMYEEIVRLVGQRAPAREQYLETVIERHRRAAADRADPGHRHRTAQALLLRLPEDDRARARLLRHLRPRRRADPRRLGARLLRRARHAAREVEPPSRAVQGLHRDAQVQHVPVAAHHRDRPGRQARRGADPHPRDAPLGRVRHRRALALQADRGGWQARAR